MNELSELLVSSTTDTISAQPMKLTEQLLDNATVQSELERRKVILDQLHSNIETLKKIMTNSPDVDSIKGDYTLIKSPILFVFFLFEFSSR
jgi:hypothetical protein